MLSLSFTPPYSPCPILTNAADAVIAPHPANDDRTVAVGVAVDATVLPRLVMASRHWPLPAPAPVGESPLHVGLVCHGLKVTGINAVLNAADVVKLQPFRHGSNQHFVSKAMGVVGTGHTVLPAGNPCIPRFRDLRGPEPTGVGVRREVSEAALKGFVGCHSSQCVTVFLEMQG